MAELHIPSVNEEIRSAFKRLTLPHGWQSAFAKRLGVERNSMSVWLAGKVTPGKQYWADIESELSIPEGTLARAATTYFADMFGQAIVFVDSNVLIHSANEQFATAARDATVRPKPRRTSPIPRGTPAEDGEHTDT